MGTILKDGRFAFLMVAEYEDLRSLIDRRVLSSQNGRPFSKRDEEWIMYFVALGMYWLHSLNIVHRDLKASNVLMEISTEAILVEPTFDFGHCSMEIWDKLFPLVAHFECSMGVIGTGFFGAPEILKACRDGNASQRQELFTQQADVYSYGMTCYEVLTGKIPFDDLSFRKCINLVLQGQHLEVPEYIDDWVRDLLSRCWQFNPEARPTFKEILNIFEANSESAQSIKIEYEDEMTQWNKPQLTVSRYETEP